MRKPDFGRLNGKAYYWVLKLNPGAILSTHFFLTWFSQHLTIYYVYKIKDTNAEVSILMVSGNFMKKPSFGRLIGKAHYRS